MLIEFLEKPLLILLFGYFLVLMVGIIADRGRIEQLRREKKK